MDGFFETALGGMRLFRLALRKIGASAYVPVVSTQPEISRGIASLPFTSVDQSAAVASITSAAAAGEKLVIHGVDLTAGATAQYFTLTEETSGTVIAKMHVPANTTLQWRPACKVKLATAVKTLQLQTGAAGVVAALAYYQSEK